MKPRLLIGHPLRKERVESLSGFFEVECIRSETNKYKEILQKIAHYDALFVISHVVDSAIIDKAKRLKIISNYGVGYDKIDVAYAKKKGIAVANTPKSTSAPTATHTMALMLSLLRKVALTDRWLRNHDLAEWSIPKVLGTSPEGKTLGILGMGRIGKEVAKRARSFDMNIIYHNRNELPAGVQDRFGATYVSLSELCEQSDILSIHVPLNEQTTGLIGREEISLMKKTAFLINTARGSILDIEAIIFALKNNLIAGAGLDVFPSEPVIPKELLGMDQVVITPHNGTGTREAREAMFKEAVSNMIYFFQGSDQVSRVV